jgi:hypothetical protein
MNLLVSIVVLQTLWFAMLANRPEGSANCKRPQFRPTVIRNGIYYSLSTRLRYDRNMRTVRTSRTRKNQMGNQFIIAFA